MSLPLFEQLEQNIEALANATQEQESLRSLQRSREAKLAKLPPSIRSRMQPLEKVVRSLEQRLHQRLLPFPQDQAAQMREADRRRKQMKGMVARTAGMIPGEYTLDNLVFHDPNFFKHVDPFNLYLLFNFHDQEIIAMAQHRRLIVIATDQDRPTVEVSDRGRAPILRIAPNTSIPLIYGHLIHKYNTNKPNPLKPTVWVPQHISSEPRLVTAAELQAIAPIAF